MPHIDRPHHANTINYFLRSFHTIVDESDARSVPTRRYRETLKVASQSALDQNGSRARSVCVSRAARADHRKTRSAGPIRRAASLDPHIPRRDSVTIPVKTVNRRPIEKLPYAVSVQTLTIPTCTDPPRDSTSKRRRADNAIKASNLTQVGARRSCGGRGTANRLLVQISEADQVTDFERILDSNAILSRARGHVWRASGPPPLTAGRPRSSYSLQAVSQAYHYLFRRHEEALQPLVDRYRRSAADDGRRSPDDGRFEDLQNLSEFYEDDRELHEEIESITDRIVAEEASAADDDKAARSNFSVNLAGLIEVRSVSPVPEGPSPVERAEAGEWPESSMSGRAGEVDPGVERLAEALSAVEIDYDESVPRITFSDCCDDARGAARPHPAPRDDAAEARPPVM